MKKLIVTVSIGSEYEKLGELFHPSMHRYAERIGADFRVIRERKYEPTIANFRN